MKSASYSVKPAATSPGVWVPAALVAGGLLVSLVATWNPLVAMAAAGLAVVVLASIVKPDLATFTVLFVLYSNLAVVASRFHGVPKVVAGLFPLLLGIPLASDLILRRKRLIVTPALPLLLLFLGVQILGMAFSKNLEVTRATVFTLVFEGMLIYFLVTNVVRTPRTLRLAAWALLLAGAISAIVPCYQQLTGTPHRNYGGLGQVTDAGFRTGEVSSQGEVRQFRLAGPIGEQNRYAQNMLMLLPLGLFVFLGESSRRLRILALLFTGLAGCGLLLSFSRGSAVGFLLVVVSMLFLRTITLRQLGIILVPVALALAALPQYRTRMSTLTETAMLAASSGLASQEMESSMKRRVTEMVAAGAVFVDHPTIGVGPGMFKYYSAEYGNRLGLRRITETRKAHSLYLEVAAESGILGVLCFFSAVALTLQRLVVSRKRLLESRPGESPEERRERLRLACLVAGFMLALIAYLATGLFLHLAYIRFFYLMLALAGAAAGIAMAQCGSPSFGAPSAEPPSEAQHRTRWA